MRRLWRATSLGVLATGVVAVGASSCGAGRDSTDVVASRPAGFEATPEYLAAATADLDAVPHRFEMTMRMGIEIDGEVMGPGAPSLTGVFDGERQYSRLDMGAMSAQAGGGPTEQIVDLAGGVLYVRAPGAADMSESMPDLGAATAYVEVLGALGDRWGRADLSAVAEALPPDWMSEVTQVRVQGLDPESFVDLVAGAASVEELGTEEVQGETMTGLAASVTASEFAAAQGAGGVTSESTVAPEPGSLGDVLANLEYTVETWVDSGGHVRRLVLDQGDAMRDLAERTDVPGPIPQGLTFVLTLDLSDYGDESLRVDIPRASDTVDVTDATRALLEARHGP